MSELITTTRRALFDAIDAALKLGGHCKHYEGAIDVLHNDGENVAIAGYSNRFEDELAPVVTVVPLSHWKDVYEDDPPVAWRLELFCYVLGAHRHYEYNSATQEECWEKLAHDVVLWREEVGSRYEKSYEDAAFKYDWGGIKLMQIEIAGTSPAKE